MTDWKAAQARGEKAAQREERAAARRDRTPRMQAFYRLIAEANAAERAK